MRWTTRTVVVLSGLFLVSCANSAPKTRGEHRALDHLDIYRQHSESTDPGEFAHLLEKCPSSSEAILQHINAGLLSSFPQKDMTEAQKKDHEARTAQDIMKALKNRGNSFESGGPQATRFVGLCYHWSLLATSALRSKGFTCRVRCGFAPYLSGNKKGIDHTVIELWEPTTQRWRLIDPELIAIKPEASTRILNIQESLDPQDIARDRFHLAATAWINYRRQTVPDGFYGLFADEPSFDFVRASLIRDWLCVLGHERNVSCNPPMSGLRGKEELAYLDRIAELMLDPDKNFEELKKLSADIDFGFPRTAKHESWDIRAIPKR